MTLIDRLLCRLAGQVWVACWPAARCIRCGHRYRHPLATTKVAR